MAYYIFFFFSLLGFLQAGSLTTLPTQFDGDPNQISVNCCYISKLNQVFYTWSDAGDQLVHYSVYDLSKKTFDKDNLSVQGSSPSGLVCCCYDSKDNVVFLSWKEQDNSANFSAYTAATGNMTSPNDIIDGTQTLVSGDIVACCYNKANDKVIFSWFDDGNTNDYPKFYILDSVEPVVIAQEAVAGDVYCCSSDSDKVYFSYCANKTPKIAQVFSYDVKEFTSDSVSSISGVQPNNSIFCSYDSKNKVPIISWAEGSPTFSPYYAICNSKTPQAKSVTTDGYTEVPNSTNVASCFSTFDSSILFSWIDLNDNKCYYAVLNTKSNFFTTPATPIDSAFVIQGSIINSCYISKTNQIFLSGVGGSPPSNFPWYAIYSSTIPSGGTTLNDAINKFSPVKFQKGI